MNDNLIAFQGVRGAYSELACHAVFPTMMPLPCPSFEEAMIAVRDRDAQYAMIPVENSIAGRVADVHYLLPESGLKIIGEHYQSVVHHLLVLPGTKREDVRTVRSHIQALTQCRKYIRENGFLTQSWSDTATAVESVAALKDPTIAAIGSNLAGEIYGLVSLETDIADMQGNTTRFLILARDAITPRPTDGACITSLFFRVRSVPAALYKALGGFATCGVNITKIESYCVDGCFNLAQFYIDVEGHPDEKCLKLALEELQFFASEIHIMGTYHANPYRREHIK